VWRVFEVDSLGSLHAALRQAAAEGLPVSVSGGRMAGGGQQIADGSLHLDTRPMSRVLAFDRRAGIVKVEAGATWSVLQNWLAKVQAGEAEPWGLRQLPSAADRVTVGGGLAANVHGDGLAVGPIVNDVDSFTLVDSSGGFRQCSRGENPELFRLVIGGYGLFGVVYSVRLRLVRIRPLETVEEQCTVEQVLERFERRLLEGCLQGRFELDCRVGTRAFLREGRLVCRRVARRGAAAGPPITADSESPGRRGGRLLTELFVPRETLAVFLADAARSLEAGPRVASAMVRLVEPDRETFLPWARERSACIGFELEIGPGPGDVEGLAETTRRLIDQALARGGTYYLAHHRFARADQVLKAYPELPELLRRKRHYDPPDRFQSEWYRWYRRLLEGALA
jgi:FAD/FMN-containing dehydrogenase